MRRSGAPTPSKLCADMMMFSSADSSSMPPDPAIVATTFQNSMLYNNIAELTSMVPDIESPIPAVL